MKGRTKLHQELYHVEETLHALSDQLESLDILKRRAMTHEDRQELALAEQKALLLREYLIWRRDQIRSTWDPYKNKKKRRSIIQ